MQLSETEFLATMAEPMKRMSSDGNSPVKFGDYFDAIPTSDFCGHDCSSGSVTLVWEHPKGLYQHVLINSEDKNVFMVIVLDLANRTVLGHRLLDLNKLYGTTPHNTSRSQPQ
jgi:hypothetical protein